MKKTMRYRVVSIEQNSKQVLSCHYTLRRAEQAKRQYSRENPHSHYGFRIDEYRGHKWIPVSLV